jgi:hypothetical protein
MCPPSDQHMKRVHESFFCVHCEQNLTVSDNPVHKRFFSFFRRNTVPFFMLFQIVLHVVKLRLTDAQKNITILIGRCKAPCGRHTKKYYAFNLTL